ncbi:hypothetical protein GCM10011581_17640 [Saccharopolyspora subtropica]|uniref:Uncharacterized protein n=1 Tax=Saccharopolyspora thermophila TaxID=89367 RepID=A0A917JQU5_9PSEU|nr:hypothetical protein [Saccharopolyspora subtropica]GGI80775.1 hypothetical protein GCM10011581_17640 [Saccharopolyspora subtropica]
MRTVRLGAEPTKVGADVRAAISAWGAGGSVLGGVAVFGCRPPGGPRPLDAVIVVPRGVIVVVGVDLPEPALKVDAPLQTPWTVDGWPMVRAEGAVNPGLEALESAAALARSLQTRDLEPLPVAAIVAVGPYVGQVTQPTTDLHRGVRVVSPNTTSVLAAVRELATYERPCPVEPVQRLLRVLDESCELTAEELVAEGFPEEASADLATADTMLIPRYAEPRAADLIRRLPPRTRWIAAAAALVLLVCVAALWWALDEPAASPPPQAPAVQRVDGVEFVQRVGDRDASCVRHAFGDVQHWFEQRECRSLTRAVFETQVSGRPAAVSVAVVELPDRQAATELRGLLDSAGTGGITDLVAEGRGWPGGPDGFDNAAQVVEQNGNRLRIVQTVWRQRSSTPGDVGLRALAERGLRLTPQP